RGLFLFRRIVFLFDDIVEKAKLCGIEFFRLLIVGFNKFERISNAGVVICKFIFEQQFEIPPGRRFVVRFLKRRKFHGAGRASGRQEGRSFYR
ncbi:MAG TPA: hypothetical protein PLQ76_02035, partial [bacterium]|nr:hypothetical protein [bacterium]